RMGEYNLVRFDKLYEQGLIKNDKLIIEARLSVYLFVGIPQTMSFDFSRSGYGWHEFPIKIEGEKIHVCKRHLSEHSSVLAAMFPVDGTAENRIGIELKDVRREDFIELLHV
ncbi:hypothetical protein PFISCL1PPCAC_20937, partial [Pristionchus fissidentatus]